MTPTLMAAGRMLASARTRAALSLGVVLAVGATGTFAYWTDAVPITGATFTAGSIDLKVNNGDSITGYTTLNLSTMVPGNSVAGTLVVKNTGTAPLKYTAATTATNADTKNLRGALVVKVTGDAAVTGSSPSATCAGSALPGAGSALNASLLSTGRQLAGGASETLCIQVSLPTTITDPGLQGSTTTIDFSFNGTSDLT